MNRSNRTLKKERPCKMYLGQVGDRLYGSATTQAYGYQGWTPEVACDTYRKYEATRRSVAGGITAPQMWESIITKSGTGKVMNNCLHTRQRFVNLPFLLTFYRWSVAPVGNNTQNLYPYWRLPDYTSVWSDALTTASAVGKMVNDQMFSARAYWSMRPRFQNEISLLNTIFELKDFADVSKYLFKANGLRRAISNAKKALKNYWRFTRPRGGWSRTDIAYVDVADRAQAVGKNVKDWLSQPDRVVGDLTGLSAKGVLTYNLAIMPTIQDVASIHAATQKNVYEKIQDFEKLGREGARSHYTEKEVITNTVKPGINNYYVYGNGKHVSVVRTATMISKYKLLWQRFEDMYPRWWGLELGVDEIWNMLPLSWLIDYTWTVGKTLEYMDVDDKINILGHEYCESVKVSAELGTFLIQSHRTPNVVLDRQYIRRSTRENCLLVTGTSGTYYKRTVMDPYKGPALPKLKAPSLKQAGNMLSLARCLLF